MAHYTGQALVVELDGVALDAIRAVEIPDEQPALDVTHAGDAHGQSIPVGTTYRNGCTMEFVDDDSETAWQCVPAGTRGELVVYPRGLVSGAPVLTMNSLITHRERPLKYDDAALFGVTFNARDYSKSVGACLLSGDPTPDVIATYDPDAVVVGGQTVQGVVAQGLDTDGAVMYVSAYTYYDVGDSRHVIDRVPIADDGEMLTGALARDARVETTAGSAGVIEDVRVTADYVYGVGADGLWIWNKALTLVGRCDATGMTPHDAYLHTLEVRADERFVFAGGSDRGVAIFDVSSKAAPVLVWYGTPGTGSEMLAWRAPYLYTADYDWNFTIYEVRTPSAPVLVSETTDLFEGYTFPAAQAINRTGALGAFSAAEDTVALVDLTDPAAPTVVGTITETADPGYIVQIVGAQFAGKYVAVSLFYKDAGTGAGVGAVYLYDISAPATPVLVESLEAVTQTDTQGRLRVLRDRYLLGCYGLDNPVVVIDCCMPN
jgi:hypothetical protein